MSAIGTTFYYGLYGLMNRRGIHTAAQLNLIQQSLSIGPAQPRTDYTALPGYDGSLDKSTAYGRVYYEDRPIIWTFAIRPEDDPADKRTAVSAALNGRKMLIVPDEDPDHYYIGRLRVTDYKRDRLLRQITVEAAAEPWRYSEDGYESISESLTTTATIITLPNKDRPVVPRIVISADTVIGFSSCWTGNWVTKTYAYADTTYGVISKTTLLRDGLTVGARQPSVYGGAGYTYDAISARTSSGTGTIDIDYDTAEL